MTGAEFPRKIKAWADERKLKMTLVPHRGKGSHQTLYLGDKFAILRNPKDELKKGTLHAMLKQLGVDPSEFQ